MIGFNDIEVKIFLKILRAIVNDQPLLGCEEQHSLGLTEEQWKQLLTMARVHNLLPLVMEKASEDPDLVQLPEYNVYLTQTVIAVASQEQRTEAFLKLYREFVQNGLHPIVVKGLICRQLYGKFQNHRVSGDEDILVRKADYGNVMRIMKQQGFAAEHDELTDEQIEKLKEAGFHDADSGVSVDVHINLFGHSNEWRKRSSSYFLHVFEQYQEVEVDGVSVRTMSHTDHLLFLILHALKHLSSSGVGIRQVMDILLYMREYGEDCDWDYLHQVLEEQKADVFLSDFIHIGNRYLGFDLHAFHEPNCPEELLEDILNCGTFGNGTMVQRTAGQMTSAAMARGGASGMGGIRTIVRAAFPDKRWMMDRYPELVGKQWLLPVCWIKRWFFFFKLWGKGEENLPVEGMKIGKRRIELLKKYDMI